MKGILIAGFTALSMTAVSAETLCSPNDNSASILSSASPNAVHPKWRGQSYIGTSWTLSTDGKIVRNETGEYRRGDLISPRGGMGDQGVFVIAREWRCDP